MHLKNGAVLKRGEYRIEKLLGQGGFGIIYMAIQSGLDRKVAIKEFFMKDLCERDADTSSVTLGTSGSRQTVIRFKEKFIREAKTIASLRHPNIVNIHDVFEENGTAYYVMEYHDGGSLSSLDLPLSVEQASGYIRQIASALSVLHENKTMHLDIKPSNVLLDKKGNAVLIDFGVSKHYDQAGHQTSSTPVGISHGYAPGEQYQQNVLSFSPATDIYALGATFYKLLTGLTPPHQNEVAENGLPVFPESVPESVAFVIEKSMQPRRKDRPQSIEEFLDLLDTALSVPVVDNEETDVIPVVEPSQKPVPSPNKKSRKWLWWMLALLVAFVGAAAVLFMGKDAQPAGSSESPAVQPTRPQHELDKEKYDSLLNAASKVSLSDLASYDKAIGLYGQAMEHEEKYTGTEHESLFVDGAASAVGTLSKCRDELKKYEDDLKEYKEYIKKARQYEDQGNVDLAIKQYEYALEIESTYSDTEYREWFNSDVAVKLKEAKPVSLTGTHKNHEWVDLGLSVKWATCNVGASNPGDYGNYYAWGEIVSVEEGNESDGRLDGTSISDISGNSTYDAATANWGGDWRLPTYEELQELQKHCAWEWTTQNGHNGYKVIGPNGNSIFLPVAGWRTGAGEYNVGSIGYYWSSTPGGSTDVASGLSFDEGIHFVNFFDSNYGHSVRPVLE